MIFFSKREHSDTATLKANETPSTPYPLATSPAVHDATYPSCLSKLLHCNPVAMRPRSPAPAIPTVPTAQLRRRRQLLWSPSAVAMTGKKNYCLSGHAKIYPGADIYSELWVRLHLKILKKKIVMSKFSPYFYSYNKSLRIHKVSVLF